MPEVTQQMICDLLLDLDWGLSALHADTVDLLADLRATRVSMAAGVAGVLADLRRQDDRLECIEHRLGTRAVGAA